MSVKIVWKDSYTCFFLNSDTEKSFPDKTSAMKAASDYVGNNACTKMFRDEDSYIFGPGDGTASVMVRQDCDFVEGD